MVRREGHFLTQMAFVTKWAFNIQQDSSLAAEKQWRVAVLRRPSTDARLVKEFDQALPSPRSIDRIASFVKTRAGVAVAVTGSAASGSAIGERDRVPRD